MSTIDCLTAEIPIDLLEREFQCSLRNVISRNEKVALLKQIYLFTVLSEKKIDYLVGIMKELVFNEGETIIEQES